MCLCTPFFNLTNNFFFSIVCYLDVCVVHSSSMTVLWTTINSSDSFDWRIQMIQRFLHVRCWKAKSKCWLLKIVFCSIFISNDCHFIFWGFGLTEYFIKYHTSWISYMLNLICLQYFLPMKITWPPFPPSPPSGPANSTRGIFINDIQPSPPSPP